MVSLIKHHFLCQKVNLSEKLGQINHVILLIHAGYVV